ncbi:hypothetical protein KA089_00670 [Candidatus Woesebacteria bacterium]|nr:hypothetical protein [Candidatus Woesebacteria bacterium]
MKKELLRSPIIYLVFLLFVLLTIFFSWYSLFLSSQLSDAKQKIEAAEVELTELKNNPAIDPIISYVFGLNQYDPKGSKSLPYECYGPEKPKNLSEKDLWWYNASSHFPTFPTDDPKINIIQAELKDNNMPSPSKICLSPVADDYLVVSDTADLYRFGKDLSYEVYTVSDKFDWFDIISWHENGDLVYSPASSIGGYSMIVYVFTNMNEDILLEYCESVPTENNYQNFVCKDFNKLSSNSKYVPSSLLYSRLMPSYW